MTHTITYLDDDVVTEVRLTTAPHFRSATGYGRKIPLPYMLRIAGRWHRVYTMVYGNSGTTYVLKGGVELLLDIDTENRLDMYATAANRSPETPIPQPVRIDRLSPGDRFRFQADGVASTLLAVENRSYRWSDYQGEHRLYAPGFGDLPPTWPFVFPTQAAQTEVKVA